MTNLEYSGVKIFADDSEILLEKSLDGGFHHFHVCCGCHKVHEVTMRVKGEGQLLSSHWLLPHPKESAKIISELQSVTPDLIQYELANERAADEIASLRAKLDAVCEAAEDAIGFACQHDSEGHITFIDRSQPIAQYSDDGPDAWPARLHAAIAAAREEKR